MPEFGPVPIVGQAVKLIDASVSAVFTCTCSPHNTPLFAKSLADKVICRSCRGVYQIMAASYDASKPNTMNLAIARVGTVGTIGVPTPVGVG